MNPLLKFIVKQMESKLKTLGNFSDEVENHQAFDLIMEDMTIYFDELKGIVGDVLT